MTVADLAAERRERRPIAGCSLCEMRNHGVRCFPHRLVDLADKIRDYQDVHADELLIHVCEVEAMEAEILQVLDGITSECLSDRRSAR